MEEKITTATHVRRVISYIVLVIISILCLFWFYILFINATRSHAELTKGFTLLPSTFLGRNLYNVLHGTLPVARGLLNSVIVSGSCAVLTTYFSAMTAFAIHAYRFKGREAIFTFVLAIMMIPTQVTALGFVQLMTSWGLMDNFIPLIVPSVAAPVVFFYMKQSMDATLPASLMEAARIDGEIGRAHV